MTRSPVAPETLLKVAIALVATQCIALGGGIGWLVTHPPRVQAERNRTSLSEIAATGERRKGKGGKNDNCARTASSLQDGPMPVFETEEAALDDYLLRLDRSSDLGLIFSGALDFPTIQAHRTAASECATMDCPGLLDYQAMLLAQGRRLPPIPSWKGDTMEDKARRVITAYVNIVTSQIQAAADNRNLVDLKPDSAATRAALGCEALDCPALQAYVDTSGDILARIGETIQPLPTALPEEGATPTVNRPGGKSPARRRSAASPTEDGAEGERRAPDASPR